MEFTFIKKCNSIIFNGIYKETTPTEWNAIVYRIYYNVEWNSFVLIGIQYFSMEWSLLVLIERNILLWNGVQLHWVTFNNIVYVCYCASTCPITSMFSFHFLCITRKSASLFLG